MVKQLLQYAKGRLDLIERRKKVMDDWEAYGHDRERLRELATGKELPLEPAMFHVEHSHMGRRYG